MAKALHVMSGGEGGGGEGGQHYVPRGYTAVFRAGQQEFSLIITQAGS
jgi:hypothetical protein